MLRLECDLFESFNCVRYFTLSRDSGTDNYEGNPLGHLSVLVLRKNSVMHVRDFSVSALHSSSLTQYGHNDIVFDDLYRSPGNEVERDDDVTLVHEGVPGGSVRRLELHGQSSEKDYVDSHSS